MKLNAFEWNVKCKTLDETYNHRSRDSQFDPDADEKIRKNKRWNPWENYQDCIVLVLLTHYVLPNFMLRGRKEVSFFLIFYFIVIFYKLIF